MKKIVRLMCTIIIVSVLFISGCEGGIAGLFKLDTPQIESIGNVIQWQPIEKAEEYDILFNEKVIATTKDTYYILETVEEVGQINVVAKTEKRSSDKSNGVRAIKTENFKQYETQTVELKNNNKINVAPNINYVTVTGTAINTCLIIAERTTDIVIKLENVTMTSPNGFSCIATVDNNYDSTKNNFSAIIIAEGINTLNGKSVTVLPSQPATNSEKDGQDGIEGGSGIVFPKIAIMGSGSLTLSGGNGGKGGKGADSAGWVAAVFGDGGDGGDGGYGIKATKIAVAMEYSGICKCSGGEGGKGGNPGANGSIISGPIYSAAGNYERYYGKDGEPGGATIGELFQYRGSFIV